MGRKPSEKLTLLSCIVTISALTACSNSKWQEVAPKTGDPIAEQQKAPTTPPLKQGQEVVVIPDRLPGRTDPNQPLGETPITLEGGDRLRVKDPNPKGKEGYVEVVVVDTRAPSKPTQPILVPREYVAPEAPPKTQEQDQADRYFMIQNVATEKSRIYENCVSKKSDGSCVHRLILESEMTAGEDTRTKERRTLLGSFRITQWYKFYQDKQDLFPSFYAPGFPKLPDEGASVQTWLSKKYLPEGKGQMRGAFGWYTAHLGPNADEQWTHGTFGWSEDGDKFIRVTREPKYDHLRSAGCTRIENQAIAFARDVMPKGSKVIRIYAKEGYRDEKLTQYDFPVLKWKFILTKEGINSPLAPTARQATVAKQNPTDNDILDAGTFSLNHTPVAVEGNLYKVPASELKGVFLVDEGRVVGYQHPKSLKVGGHADRKLPSLVLSSDTSYTLARKKSKTETLKPVAGNAGPQPQQ